ncbi:hypothetical protein [Nostoc sp. TCL26-01]|nr:hypothetical protein [Nostoc sp. TCL26-01]
MVIKSRLWRWVAALVNNAQFLNSGSSGGIYKSSDRKFLLRLV